MTFYLKYRPQKFSELDLVSVRKELEMILASGKFAHAYLFVGPRGTGKTSAARILAKVVNCSRKKPIVKIGRKQRLAEPCNNCISCREITSGNALDLIEIDAASNRGIDDIRELRERIKLAPTKAKYKVYIIDEVHMLTREAFNALLKTLEEPPGHTLFILCTTEPHRVPDTISSRCTRILFSKASQMEIISSLKKVVAGEKISCEDGVLEAIAESVDGSFRDGVKILEQLTLRVDSGKRGKRKIKLADVQEVIGLVGEAGARDFLQKLAVFERQKSLAVISKMSRDGVSFQQFIRIILELLRKLLLTEVGVLNEERVEALDINSIKLLIRLFHEAAISMKTTMIEELPLELAVVEWIGEGEDRGNERTVGKKNESTGSVVRKKAKTRKIDVSILEVQESWPKVLENLRPQNHSVEALLKATQPLKLVDQTLIIEVAYKFHKEQLELTRYRKMVEAAVSQVISDGLMLEYRLRGNKKKNREEFKKHANVSGDVEDDEMVKAAEEIFGSK